MIVEIYTNIGVANVTIETKNFMTKNFMKYIHFYNIVDFNTNKLIKTNSERLYNCNSY